MRTHYEANADFFNGDSYTGAMLSGIFDGIPWKPLTPSLELPSPLPVGFIRSGSVSVLNMYRADRHWRSHDVVLADRSSGRIHDDSTVPHAGC